MKKWLFFIISLSFFLMVCNMFYSITSSLSEKEVLVRKMEAKVSKEIKDKMNLIPIGFGSQMMNEIQMLHLAFQYYHPVNLEEGRRLLVKAAIEYIKEINSNEKLRKYLSRHPFYNVEIMIILRKPDGSDVDPGDFSVISLVEGKLQFKSYSTNQYEFETYQETFEEAWKLLEEEKKKAA